MPDDEPLGTTPAPHTILREHEPPGALAAHRAIVETTNPSGRLAEYQQAANVAKQLVDGSTGTAAAPAAAEQPGATTASAGIGGTVVGAEAQVGTPAPVEMSPMPSPDAATLPPQGPVAPPPVPQA